MSSSDQTIQHTFQYNHLGDLLQANDSKENLSIKRTIDPFGNVTQEIFTSDLCVDKEYDEYYLYDGQHEIGTFTSNHIPKNLRVLGIKKHKKYLR